MFYNIKSKKKPFKYIDVKKKSLTLAKSSYNNNQVKYCMENIKKIMSTGSTHYPLGLHADLQMRLYALVKDVDPKKILLKEEDIKTWKADVNMESDVARIVRISELTESLNKKNKTRNQLITELFGLIRLAAKSPVSTRSVEGKRLKLIVDTYKGLQHESAAEKTAHIIGLLHDLEQEPARTATIALQLVPIISMLSSMNEEFNEVRMGRADERVDLSKIPSGKSIRKKNDATSRAIFHFIELGHSSANAADKVILSELIDKINQAIRETKTTFRGSKAQSGSLRPVPGGKGGNLPDDWAEEEDEKGKS